MPNKPSLSAPAACRCDVNHSSPLITHVCCTRQVHWRFTHNRDIVPSVPPGYMGFYHLSREASGAVFLFAACSCVFASMRAARRLSGWGLAEVAACCLLPAACCPRCSAFQLMPAQYSAAPQCPPFPQVWLVDILMGHTLVGVCDDTGEDISCHNSMCHLGLCSSGGRQQGGPQVVGGSLQGFVCSACLCGLCTRGCERVVLANSWLLLCCSLTDCIFHPLLLACAAAAFTPPPALPAACLPPTARSV